MDSTKPKGRNKIFLPLFFIGPALICLSFYYFFIRKPFTQTAKPVFKSLPHFGEFKGIESGDSSFLKVANINLYNADNKLQSKDLHFVIYNFPMENNEKESAMMSANAFRIQKKIDHIKKFMMVSLCSDSIENINEKINDEKRKVHSGTKHWNFYISKNAEYNLLRKSIIAILPHFNADSLNSYFFLTDSKNHLRGYYKGTSVASVNRMAQEVVVINGEFKFKNKQNKDGNKDK